MSCLTTLVLLVQTLYWITHSSKLQHGEEHQHPLENHRGDNVRPIDHGAVDHIQVGFRPAEIVGSFVAGDLPRVGDDG